MALFGKRSNLPDPAEAFPGKWVVRQDDKHYPATFETLIDWFRQNKIPTGCSIFNPAEGKWLTPEATLPLVLTNVIVTTTPGVDGHHVKRYIGIESVEIVVGTGILSEFAGDFADFLGQRSGLFEQKLQRAKVIAIQKLKFLALQQGGNAVIGVDLDYTEFSGNRVGVVANGTIVEITEGS